MAIPPRRRSKANRHDLVVVALLAKVVAYFGVGEWLGVEQSGRRNICY
jgi:hypothetical protein